jgi:DNA uptake protein ComE-like DNA-binding protein
MINRLIPLALSVAMGLFGGSPSLAAGKAEAAASQPATNQAKASAPSTPIKLVDINSASRAELKTLPGIGDVEADRIIAARPYPSKTKLTVDKVISALTYQGLTGRIVAKQPVAPQVKKESKSEPKP